MSSDEFPLWLITEVRTILAEHGIEKMPDQVERDLENLSKKVEAKLSVQGRTWLPSSQTPVYWLSLIRAAYPKVEPL